MIVRKVRLAPFGAVADKTYSFKKGLNVLYGPNEAGKSTIINAIYAILFIPSRVRKSSEEWKGFLKDCLPYPAGDTARVEIEFESTAGEIIFYKCAWGGETEEQMILPGGNEINDPSEARKTLGKKLRFGAGTYRGVLFARQEEMNRTFERLKENREALGTVSGLLRSALHESGGVSLEELELKINHEHDRLLQNWDSDLDGPRGGRDFNNPHKKNIGAILEAYYKREEHRLKLKDTKALEEKITGLNQELNDKSGELSQVLSRLKKMEIQEEEVRKLSSLEPRLESVREKEAGLKTLITEWPRVEERIAGLEREIEENNRRLVSLQQELQEAERISAARQKREMLKQAKPLQEEVQNQEAQLKKLPPVGKDELQYLEQKHRDRKRFKELAEAMKITVLFQTKTPRELIVTSGLEKSQKFAVEKETSLKGAGRLIIEGSDWTLNIQAGEEDVDSLIEQAGKAENEYALKLKELSLDGLEQASEIFNQREELARNIEGTRIKLESILGQQTIEELEEAVAEAGPDKSVRDPEQIKADVEEVKLAVNSSKYRLEQENEKLQQWAEKHGSHDRALDELAGLRQQSAEIIKELNSLKPLPAEYENAEEFMAALKKLRNRHQELKDRFLDLKTGLVELQGHMPEESTEELQAFFEIACDELEKLKRQGRAIGLVREEFYALKEELDVDTYLPLRDATAKYLALATSNRYSLPALKGALPESITSKEGRTLPVNLLSAGTTSGAALALRLGMAEYLLKEAGGFLIMDDPLVNLDPERKQSSARAVQEFGRKKQVLIATCDPGTADLLEGNVVPV